MFSSFLKSEPGTSNVFCVILAFAAQISAASIRSSSPGQHSNVEADGIPARSESFRALPLGRTDFKFEGVPPKVSRIPLSELLEYGHITSLPAYNAHPVEERSVIGSDDRTLVQSTAFPYSTIGRVVASDTTYCTGTLVGDRVVLTASHCYPWHDTSVSLIFQPDFFDKEQFGHYDVIAVNAAEQNPHDDFNGTACGIEFDYAILELNTSISSKVGGYMGVQQWSTSTSTGLTHVGYPQALSGGSRPYQQINIQATVSSSLQCDSVGPLSTTCDATEGQSGGPLFVPSNNMIVGAFSAGGTSTNVFASGSLSALVAWGRSNWK